VHQLLQSPVCFWGDMRFHHGLVFVLRCGPHLSVIIQPLEGNVMGAMDASILIPLQARQSPKRSKYHNWRHEKQEAIKQVGLNFKRLSCVIFCPEVTSY
jgi:hypothetical protein